MHIVTEIAQTFRCAEKIALCSPVEIQLLMNQGNFHSPDPSSATGCTGSEPVGVNKMSTSRPWVSIHKGFLQMQP